MELSKERSWFFEKYAEANATFWKYLGRKVKRIRIGRAAAAEIGPLKFRFPVEVGVSEGASSKILQLGITSRSVIFQMGGASAIYKLP